MSKKGLLRERESLITEEERIFERLFSSLALVVRLRKTLIHDGKDTAKEKAEGKTTTTRRRRRTEDDKEKDKKDKKEEQKRFRKRRSFKSSRGKDMRIIIILVRRQKQLFCAL